MLFNAMQSEERDFFSFHVLNSTLVFSWTDCGVGRARGES